MNKVFHVFSAARVHGGRCLAALALCAVSLGAHAANDVSVCTDARNRGAEIQLKLPEGTAAGSLRREPGGFCELKTLGDEFGVGLPGAEREFFQWAVYTGRLWEGEEDSGGGKGTPSADDKGVAAGIEPGRGVNCMRGLGRFDFNAAYVPAGYTVVSFDGFKYVSSDNWHCLDKVAKDHGNDWFPSITDGECPPGGGITCSSLQLESGAWSYKPKDADDDCKTLDEDCFRLTVSTDVRVMSQTAYGNDWHTITKRGTVDLYARCPPSSSFSQRVGACLIEDNSKDMIDKIVEALFGSAGTTDGQMPGDEGQTIGERKTLEFTPYDMGFSEATECPAPKKITSTLLGKDLTIFDFTKTCGILKDWVRPLVLALAAASAMFIVLGMNPGGAES